MFTHGLHQVLQAVMNEHGLFRSSDTTAPYNMLWLVRALLVADMRANGISGLVAPCLQGSAARDQVLRTECAKHAWLRKDDKTCTLVFVLRRVCTCVWHAWARLHTSVCVGTGLHGRVLGPLRCVLAVSLPR